MMKVLVLLSLLLSSCATYDWQEVAKVDKATIYKIVTPEAAEICRTLTTNPLVLGCAVRVVSGTSSRCVVFIPNNDVHIKQHELLHCFGYEHQ